MGYRKHRRHLDRPVALSSRLHHAIYLQGNARRTGFYTARSPLQTLKKSPSIKFPALRQHPQGTTSLQPYGSEEGAKLSCTKLHYILLLEDRFRKFLAWEEAHALFRGNVNWFAIAWVNSFAGCARAHLERAIAYQPYFVAPLKRFADGIQRGFEYC